MPTSSRKSSPLVASLTTYFNQLQQAIHELDLNQLSQVVQVLLEANQRKATIFIFGNGGSAATASHFANDLAKGCIVEGQNRFRAIALTENTALLTAWANDSGYDQIFAEQLKGLVNPADVVIGISGSGNSRNVLNGIIAGREAGAYTIGFCGYSGGKLRELIDLPIHTDCGVMEQVEDLHSAICHNIATTLRGLLAQQEPVTMPETSHPVLSSNVA